MDQVTWEVEEKLREMQRPGQLNAKSLKVTLVLDPAEMAKALSWKSGGPRVEVAITAAGRNLSASLNGKSVRRSLATIAEAGPAGVACILQGRLVGSVIEDAGLLVQPKTPK